MNTSLRQWLTGLVVASLCVFSFSAYTHAAEPAAQAAPAPPAPPAVETPTAEPAAAAEAPAVETPDVEAAADDAVPEVARESESEKRARWETRWWSGRHWDSHSDDLVSVGGDSRLEKGRHANSVVTVFGSSTSEGDVSDAVVSVLGDTRASGTVGDSVVAVLGDNYVNAKVYGDVVAVMGNIELGPQAEVNGEVVVVGGSLKRDPSAIVHGGVQRVFGPTFGSFHWLRPWVQHCMLLGRPLAFAHGLGWAWALALGFLALYTFVALLFRDTVDRCVQVLDTRPGQTIVAALLGLLLTPVIFALLFVTVIGIAFIPFAGAALFMATAFGKVVVLAWIGRKVIKVAGEGASALHTAAAVVIGGAVVLVLYVVPVVGFIVYKALGILGFGVATYTVILQLKARREAAAPLSPAPPPPDSSGPVGGEPYIGGGAAAFAGGPDGSMASATDSTASAFGTTPSPDSPEAVAGSAGPGSATDAGFGTASASASGFAGGTAAGTSAPGVAAAAPPPSTLPRADFMVRMGALLIDVILVSVLFHLMSNSHDVQLVALAAYGAIMWKLKGTTIGGIVFGLQVVRADGRPVDWSTAVVRALSCFLSLVVVGLGFIWIAFDDQRQGWHDKIAGTLVVRVPKGVSLL